MVTIAKIGGKIYEVLKVADTVAFSTDRGWVLVTPDIADPKSQAARWVSATSNFIWIRTFRF